MNKTLESDSAVIDDPAEIARLKKSHPDQTPPSEKNSRFSACRAEASALLSQYEDRISNSVNTESIGDLTRLQGYLEENRGLNIKKAWKQTTGQGVRIHLIDDGFMLKHRNFKGGKIKPASPDQPRGWHGTAVLGVLAAQKKGFGMTGIAHKANIECHSISTGMIDCLRKIVKTAKAGDTFTSSTGIAAQLENKEQELAPLVCNPAYKALLDSLAKKGVTCLISLPNNAKNYNSVDRYFSNLEVSTIAIAGCSNNFPSKRWSIPKAKHGPNWTDPKGSPYHWPYPLLNAWAEGVATVSWDPAFHTREVYVKSEKCNASTNPPIFRAAVNTTGYTDGFWGCSAATPIVAGACALIQSYAMKQYNLYLDWQEMYALISQTGYDEARKEGIGIRPNTFAAMEALDRKMKSKVGSFDRGEL